MYKVTIWNYEPSQIQAEVNGKRGRLLEYNETAEMLKDIFKMMHLKAEVYEKGEDE